MEIKILLGQISMDTNHAGKRTSQFEFLSCICSISSKYAEKKLKKIFTQFIEIRSDSVKGDNFFA